MRPTSFLSLTFGLFFFDADLDGRTDLLLANGHVEPTVQAVQKNVTYRQAPILFWNGGGGRFTPLECPSPRAQTKFLALPPRLVMRITVCVNYDFRLLRDATNTVTGTPIVPTLGSFRRPEMSRRRRRPRPRSAHPRSRRLPLLFLALSLAGLGISSAGSAEGHEVQLVFSFLRPRHSAGRIVPVPSRHSWVLSRGSPRGAVPLARLKTGD